MAVNVADTARSATETVKRYRGLLARTKQNDFTDFGTLFEYVLEAAYAEKMADCIKYYAHFWLVPWQSLSNEPGLPPYRIRIRFDKPIPNVVVYMTGQDRTTVLIPFSRSGRGYDANLDGYQTITISEQTVFAVGDLLAGRSIPQRSRRTKR